jgi:hypothetical protein
VPVEADMLEIEKGGCEVKTLTEQLSSTYSTTPFTDTINVASMAI